MCCAEEEAFYDDRELYFQLLSPATAPTETDDTAPYQRSEDSEEAASEKDQRGTGGWRFLQNHLLKGS